MATITIPGMFLEGTHAARPAATAVGGGSLYSCSDHKLIYQSDGAAWSTWADATGTGSSGVQRARAATQGFTATAFADVVGLTFPVAIGAYHFRFVVFLFTAASTTGIRLAVNGPTTSALRYGGIVPTAAAGNSVAHGNQQVTAYDTPVPATTSGPGGTAVMALIEGTAVFTASGTLALRCATEVAASQVAVEEGSYGEVSVI